MIDIAKFIYSRFIFKFQTKIESPMMKYHQYILSSCESFYSVEFRLDRILHPFQNVIDLLNK